MNDPLYLGLFILFTIIFIIGYEVAIKLGITQR